MQAENLLPKEFYRFFVKNKNIDVFDLIQILEMYLDNNTIRDIELHLHLLPNIKELDMSNKCILKDLGIIK